MDKPLNFYLDRIVLKDGKVLYGVMALALSFFDVGFEVLYPKYLKQIDPNGIKKILKGSRITVYGWKDGKFYEADAFDIVSDISNVGFVPASVFMRLIEEYDKSGLFGQIPVIYARALVELWKSLAENPSTKETPTPKTVVSRIRFIWDDEGQEVEMEQDEKGDIRINAEDVLDIITELNITLPDEIFDKGEYLKYSEIVTLLSNCVGSKSMSEPPLLTLLQAFAQKVALFCEINGQLSK